MSEWDAVKSLLYQLRKVSDTYFRTHGKWTVYEQICHAHSEVSELYEGLRKGNRENILEEIWDIVFSALTISHILDTTDEELIESMVKTLRKIQGRAIEDAYKWSIERRKVNPDGQE